MHRINDPDGIPNGVYTAFYGRIQRDGTRVSYASFDRGLSAGGALRQAESLEPDEYMRGNCESQPGGFTAWGSYSAYERDREYHDDGMCFVWRCEREGDETSYGVRMCSEHLERHEAEMREKASAQSDC